MFNKIWKFFKKIWKFLKDLFCPRKKPLVRITILTMAFIFMFFSTKESYAQRTSLPEVHVSFDQPFIDNVDGWKIFWGTDSISINKTDTIHVKINDSGQWLNWSNVSNVTDTMKVSIIINQSFNYNQEYTFNVVVDNLNEVSQKSDSVKTFFMVSDINKVNSSDFSRGYKWGDNSVDGLDLIQLSKNFGKTGLGILDYYDITGDGNVDGLDLIHLSKNFGNVWIP